MFLHGHVSLVLEVPQALRDFGLKEEGGLIVENASEMRS